MIAKLSGVVDEQGTDSIVLNVQGVGYGVFVSSEDAGHLASGDKVTLYIYEHIREQQHDLFGFVTRDDKAFFEQLLGVNGIGPKMALNMLSIGTAQSVRQAIASGDVKFIQQANGVGKRVAERVVVELKDKVGLIGVDLASTGLLTADDALLKDEAVEALVSLGYTPQDAAKALKDIDTKLPTPERITLALKVKT